MRAGQGPALVAHLEQVLDDRVALVHLLAVVRVDEERELALAAPRDRPAGEGKKKPMAEGFVRGPCVS